MSKTNLVFTNYLLAFYHVPLETLTLGITAIYVKWHFSGKTKWVNFLSRENFLSNHNSWFFFLIQLLKLDWRTRLKKIMDFIETTVILNLLAILGIFGNWTLELSMEAQAIPAFVLLFILNPLAAILVLMRWKFRIYLYICCLHASFLQEWFMKYRLIIYSATNLFLFWYSRNQDLLSLTLN